MRRSTLKIITFWLGPIAAVVTAVTMASYGWGTPAILAGSLTMLCALWWVFEPIPIPATSLIPLGVFPLLGVLDSKQVAESYGSSLILLLFGGFLISKAMEKSGTHRRLALSMLNLFGANSYRKLIFGFMAATALLSMWISNTATTLMMLPIALAVVEPSKNPKLAITILFAIAFSANIGGLGTPIGTPPNIIFMKVYEDYTGTSISFLQWMLYAIPIVIIFLPLMLWWLTRNLGGGENLQIPNMGQWRAEERRILYVFALTALAWVTMSEPYGGWKQWLGLSTANSGSVALCAAILLFIIPDGKGGKLMDWESTRDLPWGVLLLFAGGIAIARAFVETGLSQSIGELLSSVSQWPLLLMIFSICIGVTFLTEITSNTATTTLLMPILAAAGIASGIDPALLMIPAAMSASCAFMLPVATAPNAVIFGTGKFSVQTMSKIGFGLNIIGAFVISAVCYVMLG